MSQRRKLRRAAIYTRVGTDAQRPDWPSRPTTLRDLLANLLSPEEFAQLAGEGDEPCDVRPPAMPSDTRCRFRKGHTCPCRFFGDVESGP
jgi:hypothetical protein